MVLVMWTCVWFGSERVTGWLEVIGAETLAQIFNGGVGP
jgi:uncharacterized membrane protein YcfT